jgi:hypothetical protein
MKKFENVRENIGGDTIAEWKTWICAPWKKPLPPVTGIKASSIIQTSLTLNTQSKRALKCATTIFSRLRSRQPYSVCLEGLFSIPISLICLI